MNQYLHASEDRNETGPTSLSSEAHRFAASAASSLRSYSTVGHSHGSTQHNSFPLVQRSASAVTSRQHNHRGVMITGLVGNGISGILYKWVNYGRGWRARWFVLQDGVLSYFKIHGSNKLVLNGEVERGSMVIGEESLRRIAGHRNNPSRQSKPVCEIHLMVCSIRESKSDERRFSVRTGAKKRLHLRAESREDRDAWVEALRAVKGLYPRSPKNAEIMAPHETMLMSTQKLRQRLMEEGVSEIAIQECENIMRSELAQMHKHILALKQKYKLLLESFRHLEASLFNLRFSKIFSFH